MCLICFSASLTATLPAVHGPASNFYEKGKPYDYSSTHQRTTRCTEKRDFTPVGVKLTKRTTHYRGVTRFFRMKQTLKAFHYPILCSVCCNQGEKRPVSGDRSAFSGHSTLR